MGYLSKRNKQFKIEFVMARGFDKIAIKPRTLRIQSLQNCVFIKSCVHSTSFRSIKPLLFPTHSLSPHFLALSHLSLPFSLLSPFISAIFCPSKISENSHLARHISNTPRNHQNVSFHLEKQFGQDMFP